MGVAILWDTTQQILWVRQFDRSALNLCCCPCQSQRPVLRASCLKPKHSETAQRSEISIRNVQGFETHWTRSLKHITSQCQLCCLTNVFFGGLAGQLGLRFVTVFRNQLPREQISWDLTGLPLLMSWASSAFIGLHLRWGQLLPAICPAPNCQHFALPTPDGPRQTHHSRKCRGTVLSPGV